jgi:peroxiredoxin
MAELGQLEKRHAEFEKQGVRVVVISNDNLSTAQETQHDFQHLIVIADTDQNMAKAFEVVHSGVGPKGSDTNAPTTFLVDGTGKVCWLFRPGYVVERLAAEEVLKAVNENLKRE